MHPTVADVASPFLPSIRHAKSAPPCKAKTLANALVDKLNERFGTDFKQADQLFFDQIAEDAVGNETLRTAAEVNSLENFKHVFERMLEGLFIDRMDGNEEIFDRIMKDPQFRNIASDHLVRAVYERLRYAATGASSARQVV